MHMEDCFIQLTRVEGNLPKCQDSDISIGNQSSVLRMICRRYPVSVNSIHHSLFVVLVCTIYFVVRRHIGSLFCWLGFLSIKLLNF